MTSLKVNQPPHTRKPGKLAIKHQIGMSLIEVLVAVLILGIGLLGIAAMQATALRNSQSALERSQAVIQTYAILDAMRANRADALAGQYNTGGMECAAPTGVTLAQMDRARWIDAMKEGMGVAGDSTTCGSIACEAASDICTVIVQWDDSRAAGTETGLNARQVTTMVRL